MQTTHLLKRSGILISSLVAFILCSPASLRSQTENQCGQAIVTENWFKQHPELKTQYDLFQQQASQSQGLQNRTMDVSVPDYTIPVVFHILHMGGPENISDAQVIDAVSILNRDYQKKNADTINVVSTYTNNIAKVNFSFELAKLDPDGNCTNGIIRHYTPKTNWDANNLSWFTYSWPRDKYLNIYIVKTMNIGATAYAFLPPVNVPDNADCIVCMHMCCGSIGTGILANSRTLTHEVAHWFNVPHIWGSSNQAGVACGDDGINDTPITKGFLTCDLNNTNICNPAIYENVQNYMDYAPCKLMFTNGQANRMTTTINGALCDRNNLSTPANLAATGITTSSTNCIPLVEIEALPSLTVCLGTTLTLRSFTSNANVNTYNWSATNGALLGTPSASSTTFSLNTIGSSMVMCVVTNTNGTSTASTVINIENPVPQVTITSMESFEMPALPASWSVLNPTSPMALWGIETSVGSAGNRCMFVNAEDAPGGSVEVLQTASYDFLNNPGSIFTFKCAYARQTAAQKDVFKVQASKDCGGTWTDVLFATPANLSTGSGEISTTLFFPTSAQWKGYNVTESPLFTPFADQSNVKFRFYFQEAPTGFGNRIYLDQINFETPTGINEFTRSIGLTVFPNPATSSLYVNFSLSDSKRVKIYLTGTNGSKVMEFAETIYNAGTQNIHLSNLDKLAPAIYFVTMEFEGLKVVRKIVVE